MVDAFVVDEKQERSKFRQKLSRTHQDLNENANCHVD
jgi:hypothetical protein